MKYLLARMVFWLSGWKLDVTEVQIPLVRNTVVIAAPHTSNYDFVFAMGTFWLMRLPIKFFIKDFYTKWYFFGFFKWLGAIGVDRSRRSNLVDYAASLLIERDDITLVVPAESTRKAVDKWKTGFYHIALKSGKNISLGYLDYGKKYAGILDVIPAGEKNATFDHIQYVYKDVEAKYPELYNKVIH